MTLMRLHAYNGALTLLVGLLVLLSWNSAPEGSNALVAALITMPIIWFVSAFMYKCVQRFGLNEIERKFFTASVILAGLLIAFSLAAKLIGGLNDIDPNLIKRAREVFLGFVLLYLFNMMPKMIGQSLKGKCSNAAVNAVRRFSGWVLVLGAVGYIGAWIFAPMSNASNIAHGSVGLAVGLVIIRLIAAMLEKRRA